MSEEKATWQRWLGIGTVISAVAGLIVALLAVVDHFSPKEPSNAVEPPQPSASFATPRDHEAHYSKQAIVAGGELEHLAGQSLWLMDSDGEDFAADMKARIIGDRWTARSHPPFGRPLTLVLVIADAGCDSTLAKLASSNDSTTENLPAGCHIADQVDVVIVP